MRSTRTLGWAAACAVAVGFGGCRSATTRIYTLESVAPASHVDIYHAPALRVDSLNVPLTWDRLEILKLSASGTLQISDFDHWAAPLTQMTRHALSEDLEQRLPPGSVIYPRLPKPSDALGVDVDILDVNIVASQVSMRASWIISRSADASTAKRSAVELRSAMISEEPAAVAHAWSDLIGQLADHIAVDAASFNTP